MNENLSKPIEQDMVDLAREGLVVRLKRARQKRWRLEMAKRSLEEMEKLNERAVQKLGDPLRAKQDRLELLQRHRAELHRLVVEQGQV